MSTCRSRGCFAHTSGYSVYCEKHKRALRRHGHPDQKGVTSEDLKPFRSRVKARIEKNKNNPAWGLLLDRWSALLEIARGKAEGYARGEPYNRYEKEAWTTIGKLGASAEKTDVIEVSLAMYLMQESHPGRFLSDTAFGRQLVRRVCALAPSSIASYFDYKTSKTKRVYRDMKPGTMDALARILQETFGVAGLTVARLEQQEQAAQQKEKKALHDALSELI